MNSKDIDEVIDSYWDKWFVPSLQDFVRIPNLTSMVDPEFLSNGLIQKAIESVDKNIQKLQIDGLSRQIFHTEKKLPLVVYIVEPSQGCDKNLILYGHLDKQPYGDGWLTDPTDPILKDDYMYGRGSGDDGYAPFTAMLAVKTSQQLGLKHPRVALVLETEEESGSVNLDDLFQLAKDAIGIPDALFVLDSASFDYNSLWISNSFRGMVVFDVTVQLLKQPIHSGSAGGIIPDSFRIMRQILNRIEDPETGKVCDDLQVEIPQYKFQEAKQLMDTLVGRERIDKIQMVEGSSKSSNDYSQMYLNNCWLADMSVTGAEGIPQSKQAGNVLRTLTSLRICLRIAPTLDAQNAFEIIKKKLTENVPYNAQVTVDCISQANGFCMKEYQPWIIDAIKEASQDFMGGHQHQFFGGGGSIPVLYKLQKLYPETQLAVFGILGMDSNAHGPNEKINLAFTKKFTKSMTHIISHFGKQ